MNAMNAISLFSGMGGDSLGIKMAGLNLVGYSEKESIFRETHNINFINLHRYGFKYHILL